MARSIDPIVWSLWRERLRRFESSGLTVAAYCRDEGVSQAGFYQWRKKLGNRSNSGVRRQKANSNDPAFVPVVATSFASAVVLILANGVRVEVPAGDRELVSHVVQVAGAAPAATAGATAAAGGDS